MKRNFQLVHSWWREKVKGIETPHFASADTSLSPRLAESAQVPARFSAVLQSGGQRFYCFLNQVDRDRFLTKFRKGYNARAVGKDPCP